MRVTFVGAQSTPYKNQNRATGEIREGTEHTVQVLAGQKARTIRVTEDMVKRFAAIEPMSECELVVGFETGAYGRDWIALYDLRPAANGKVAG